MEGDNQETVQDDGYRLSQRVSGHKGDVKCLVSTWTDTLISGSRDETVRVWNQRGGEFDENAQFVQENRLPVNSVAFYRQSPSATWMIFAGRKDGSIAVFSSGNTLPIFILHKHKSNVCTLFVDEKLGLLLSGSWDHSAIVWSITDQIGGPQPVANLNKHNMSVWAVTTVMDSPDHYLTGSADRTIKLWRGSEQVNTFTGHDDVVRSVISISASQFLSASNDSTVRLWNIHSSSAVFIINSGSGNYIYSLCCFKQNVVCCGEGGILEVWKADEDFNHLTSCQLIQMPVESLWSVVALNNGDIAVGGSDGNIWILSRVKERQADAEKQSQFSEQVAVYIQDSLIRSGTSEEGREVMIKVALDDGKPSMDLKYVKGSDPTIAAEKFIQDNGLPIAYLNEIVEYIKANVPEARKAAAISDAKKMVQRQIFDGQEYDHVFELTAEDGRRLHLPFNYSDDPDYTAQQFCEKNGFSINFMQKVSNFLRSQMSKPVSSIGYEDPFTGGNRYVPQNGGDDHQSTTHEDPLTGAGRYIPGESTSYMPLSSTKTDRKKPRSEFIPMKVFYQFGIELASVKAIARLREYNDLQLEEQLASLSIEQVKALEEIMTGQRSEMENEIRLSAFQVGMKWSTERVVPILDVLRIALLSPELNQSLCSVKSPVFGLILLQRMSALLISEPSDAIRILVCRIIANACVHPDGRRLLMHDSGSVIPLVVASFCSMKNAVQIAAASALANWSLLLLEGSDGVSELGPREDALRSILTFLSQEESFTSYSDDAMLRLLQAIATLMWGDATVIRLCKGRNLALFIGRMKDMSTNETIKAMARDIEQMLSAV